MKQNSCKGSISQKGFTLIELLVVVLIIGILAAIALPQYQKAVTRAKTAELFTLMDTVAKDVKQYVLLHGSLPQWSQWSETDADFSKGMVNINYHNPPFGKHFQVGSFDGGGGNSSKGFYCVRPSNGDNAVFYSFFDNTGKYKRVCGGTDCGKYINNATCFASVSDCSGASSVDNSGCSF